MLRDERHQYTPPSNGNGTTGTGAAFESLDDKVKRWRKGMKGSVTWYLTFAQEVVSVIEDWDAYKEEADGVTASQFCTNAFGNQGEGPAFWRRRARAVATLGEACRRNLHHDVAVWICDTLPSDCHDAVKRLLYRACRANSGIPLNIERARWLVAKELGIKGKTRKKVCHKCEELKAILRKHGISH